MFVPQETIRVLIVDDNAEVRRALRLVCDQGLGIHVIGEADSIGALLNVAAALYPGIVLIDWELVSEENDPGELFRWLHHAFASTIVAIGAQPEARAAALDAGADSFVYKGGPPELLFQLLQNFKTNHSHEH